MVPLPKLFHMTQFSQRGNGVAGGRRGGSRGFTLMEVLVAIVILSVGVLGALGMQVGAIRMNREVRYQAMAVTLAKELAEKMRGNKDLALTAGNPYLLADVTLTPSSTISAPAADCYEGACTPVEIANWDMYDWQLRVNDTLPSPRIRICVDSDPFDGSGLPRWACNNTGNVAVLKLAWNRAGTDGGTEFTSSGTTLPMVVLPVTAGSTE